MPDTNLNRFRAVVRSALAQLEERRQEVNDLNVFPVADGDTGDNMALTLRAVLAELDRLAAQGDRTIDDIDREEMVDSVARAALLGARGNSGVILSQVIRGAAEELVSRPGELVDPVLVGAAMARGAERAYASVREPAEGTILTVVREMASRIAREVAHMPEARLSPRAERGEQDESLAGVLERALETGEESVKRSPELLGVLREAGVVDAGGYALTVIIAGCVAALRGAEPPALAHHAPARITHPEHESSTFRYCTNFAVTGDGLDPRRFTRALERMGDSVLCVGDAHTLKVHVHTDDPEAATALFAEVGEVSHIDVADMREQVGERAERLRANGPPARCGALAVVSGAGLARLFESLGVHVLEGGPTLNPSTYDLLAGIHAVHAHEVVVLPNSANVFMAAERAGELADQEVRVVPARSQQAGLAAAVALRTDRGAQDNARAMEEVLTYVRTAAVAEAARDDVHGRFRRGEAVGFVEGDIVSWGAAEPTLRAVIGELAHGEPELITVLCGERPPLTSERVADLAPDGVEVDVREGGQPSYHWLLVAE